MSEELCKLLGLEPKTEVTQIGESLGFCNTTIKKVYPDLTKPSNFVKLLEDIKIDGIELCDWLICYSGSFCNRQDFIDNLIELINEYTTVICYLTKDIEKIKQQAQATKWDY